MEENIESTVEPLFAGTILENGYGYIPREIIRDKTLNRNSKVLYAYFMGFAGNKMTAFPSVKTICEELGFGSEDTYYKYLNELKDRGLISAKSAKNEQGKFKKNIYSITFQKSNIEAVKKINNEAKVSKTNEKKPYPKNQGTEKPYPDFSSTVNRGTNINNSLNIKEKKETMQNIEMYDDVIRKYKDISKQVSDFEFNVLSKLQNELGKELVIKAIDVSIINNKKNLGYIQTILMDWKNKNLINTEKVDEYLAKWKVKNQEAKSNREKQISRRAENSNYENIKKNSFNDYPQRSYDFDELERKLLGY